MSGQYHQPTTVEEALGLLAENPDAQVIAGGTDLMVRMGKARPADPKPVALISTRHIDELTRIEEAGERLRIGAAVPVSAVAAHGAVRASYPALVGAISVFGSPQIRNVATLAGNLCNASPGADGAPPLIVYGASVELTDSDSKRQMAVEEFVTGPGQTALRRGEIVTAIVLEPPAAGASSAFMRKGRVKMDLALASVAVLVEMSGSVCVAARLAAGAVAPIPLRLKGAEAVLVGSDLGPGIRKAAAVEAKSEVSPITDVRGSADYRRHLIGVFMERCLAEVGGGV